MYYDQILIYHFIGLCMMIFMERIKIMMINTGKDYLVFFAFFSSVFFHELAHLLVGLLTNGKPQNFSLIPTKKLVKNENEEIVHWTLGYVSWTNLRFYNAFPIGIAPIFLLIVGYLYYLNYFLYFEQNLKTVLIFYLGLFFILSNSIPSKNDFKVILHEKSFFFYMVILFVVGVVINVQSI